MLEVSLLVAVLPRSPLVEVVEVELSLLLSCLVDVAVAVEEDDCVTNCSLLPWCACWACWLEEVTTVQPVPGASEHTLRGLTGVLVEPVAFCVDRNVSSLLISVMIRWSTPLDAACCCCIESLALLRSEVADEEVTSVMVTALGCCFCCSREDDEEVALVELTVRLLVEELTAFCWATLLDKLLDALYVADCLLVMLPSGLWIIVSPASTRTGRRSAGLVSPTVPCCSERLLVVTSPRSLLES